MYLEPEYVIFFNQIRRELKSLCVLRNVSIHNICKEAGIPPATMYDFLNGRTSNLSIITLRRFLAQLGIRLSDFFIRIE